MNRWEPDPVGRLQKAALELYAERGFDETTVAEIAERAGLTERTFFRRFTDKREVLFDGSEQLQELMVAAVDAAPPSAAPMTAIGLALQEAGTVFDAEMHPRARQRQAVIDANPSLRERELVKLDTLAAALAAALVRRGVPDTAATFAAESGVTAFKVAFTRWVRDGEPGFAAHAQDAVTQLRAVTAAG